MYLRELLLGIQYILVKGNIDIQIQGVCYDSRNVIPGSLFVAIKGFQQDGNKYIVSAIKRGASVIIYEEMPEIYYEYITYIQVDNCRRVLSKLASNYYGNPTSRLKVIGVTGTNGKTSTCLILQHILNFSEVKTGYIGTIGNRYDEYHKDTNHTTPEATTLQQLMYEMLKIGVKYVIMEVSSHAIKLYRVADIQFKSAVFTNLTLDHLDFHDTMKEYFEVKKKLFYMTEDFNVVNIDDQYGQELSQELKADNLTAIEYGINKKSDVWAQKIQYSEEGTRFLYTHHGEEMMMECPILGKFMVYNLLAAIAIAEWEGVPLLTIKEAIKKLPSIPGRLEKIHINKTYHVFIDYAHTPDGLRNVLETLKDMAKGRIVVLFGCGGDRDRSKRKIMGKIAGELTDYCIITSDNPRSENPNKIIEDILVGIKETSSAFVVIPDRYKAIKYALKFAKDNDLILLAGKGHETYQILKDKIITFDEKEIIKEILENDSN
ncbi:MAG: UDP-N-acetylmuramoyl-L-alanyl-D-glutamate--2,6-diaminopimelate ligase [Eubacteriales bacterium]